MVDLQELEMTGLGEGDGFEFESLYGEEGELEGFFENEAFEFEGEEEFSGESYEMLEADPFLGGLIRNVSRKLNKVTGGVIPPTVLPMLAQQLATVAGGAVGGKQGAALASKVAGQVLREGDGEFESYGEEEAEFESGIIDRETLDEMHYNAYQASEANSEAEGDPFIADLIGPVLSALTGETSPSYEELFEEEAGMYERDEFLPALLPLAMPLISQGIGAIGKVLNKKKSTRKLTRCLPKVLKESLEEAESYGRPLNRRDVAGIVGRNTARTFGNPTAVSRALRQNRIAASRAQMRPSSMRVQGPRRIGPAMPAPAGPYGARAPFGRATPPRNRRRGPVIGYMLKPIYAAPRR